VITLYDFLRQRRGRIGSQITEAEWKAVQTRARSLTDQFGNHRNLKDSDARVVASTMKDKIPIITDDKQMIGVLTAINYPVEPWRK
jgi:hypothetical protein